jgi:hypothetical protein
MRLIGFIIALLLLDGAVEPTQGWLIALVVVTGLAVFRPRPWSPLHFRPAIDVRLVAFVLAVLLLAGTVEPTRDWLIGLSIATGVAAFMPRVIAFDLFGENDRRGWWAECAPGPRLEANAGDWGRRAEREWDRWERRADRSTRRRDRRENKAEERWGDEWR